MRIYIDSSAAVKLVADERESSALADYLADLAPDDDVFSSILLETELRRGTTALGLDQILATEVLDNVTLVSAERSTFILAAILPGTHLRSLDALHVATAISHDADTVVAYDHRLIAAARDAGIATSSPA